MSEHRHSRVDVAVIGAGQAGLAIGYFLARQGRRFVILEAGVGWVPWLMWRMDQQYRELAPEVPWVKRLPSEHMRDSVRVSTQPWTDIKAQHFAKLVEMMEGEQIFVFSTDYPHYDADSTALLTSKAFSDDLRKRIAYQNVVETYPKLSGLGI